MSTKESCSIFCRGCTDSKLFEVLNAELARAQRMSGTLAGNEATAYVLAAKHELMNRGYKNFNN